MSLMLASAWEVFVIFSVPFGGGIPAGVLLAKTSGMTWQMMTGLYLLSDLALACYFEPLLKLILRLGKRSPFMIRFFEEFRKSLNKTIMRYGSNPGVFKLVMVAFGVDPMTGRATALAAGHGFLAGWAIAILGDMLFFMVLMGSTLWLNSILGDGTLAAVIIMVLMMGGPALIRRIRERRK